MNDQILILRIDKLYMQTLERRWESNEEEVMFDE